MIASPRAQTGVRAYFADMMQFDLFGALNKDAALYPNYSSDVAKQAQEQALRTIVDELVVRNGDYRDIFTTNKTYLTPTLASAYGLPLTTKWGDFQDWQPVELPANMPQAGVLTQIGFAALHSSSGKTSPTLRGKALREVFLCQEIPPPPPDVDFSKFAGADGKVSLGARADRCAHDQHGLRRLPQADGSARPGAGELRHQRHVPHDGRQQADRLERHAGQRRLQGRDRPRQGDPRQPADHVLPRQPRLRLRYQGVPPTNNERVWMRDQLLKDWAADGYRYPDTDPPHRARSGLLPRAMPPKAPRRCSAGSGESRTRRRRPRRFRRRKSNEKQRRE